MIKQKPTGRLPCRPRKSWLKAVEEDMRHVGVREEGAMDREEYHKTSNPINGKRRRRKMKKKKTIRNIEHYRNKLLENYCI